MKGTRLLMFVQTQDTPNPNTLKFLPGCEVIKHGSLHINRADLPSDNPLVNELFTISEIESVFLAADFVSVTKNADAEWFIVKADIIAVLIDFFAQNQAFEGHNHAEDLSEDADIVYDEETAVVVEEIKSMIETRVRPSVAMDGGDIVFKRFVDGIVYLELRGACAGCPSSTATLKQGIESMLKHYVPQVVAVQAA